MQLPSEQSWWELEFVTISYALFISPFPFQSRLFKSSSSCFSISTSASSLISWSNPKRCNKPWTFTKELINIIKSKLLVHIHGLRRAKPTCLEADEAPVHSLSYGSKVLFKHLCMSNQELDFYGFKAVSLAMQTIPSTHPPY